MFPDSALGCVGLTLLLGIVVGLFSRSLSLANVNKSVPLATSIPTIVESPQYPTEVIFPSDTPPPTELLLPTEEAIDPFMAQRQEVEKFIFDYWDLVSNKEFSTAYTYLSMAFKARNHPNGIDDFSSGFKYTDTVQVLNAEVITIDSSSAIVDAELEFVTTGGSPLTAFHRYTLIRENGHWVIDSARKK